MSTFLQDLDNAMYPQIVQVTPGKDYRVFVYFADGKIVLYDAKHLLTKRVFAPLKDEKVFKGACTILNGTLAWDIAGNRDETKCLDIAPDMLYSLDAVEEED